MQVATPELLDFSKESPKTLEMYGVNDEPTRPFATNCLLARRMVERGVRFVQLIHGSWDHHSDLIKGVQDNCDIIDRPTAALLKDLKQRGLLENTLVVWGGEFGRTPLVEDRTPGREETRGRDHHRQGFTMWMAGGGIQGRADRRQDGRLRVPCDRRPDSCPRLACHDAALLGFRSQAVDVSPPRPGFSVDGCRRKCRPETVDLA